MAEPPSYNQAVEQKVEKSFSEDVQQESQLLKKEKAQITMQPEPSFNNRGDTSHQSTFVHEKFARAPPLVSTQPESAVQLVRSASQAKFGKFPARNIHCSYCNRMCGYTLTKQKISSCAYCWGCVLFCFASPLCCWVPCVLTSMKDTDHYCQHCMNKLGSYTPKRAKANGILTALLLVGLGVGIALIVLRGQMAADANARYYNSNYRY